MTGGPIFTLRLYGLLCPCFEKSEDRSARASLSQVNGKLGTSVYWHVGGNTSSGTIGSGKNIQAATGFVKSLFGGSSPASATSFSSRQHSDGGKPPIQAQIRVVDATKESINNGAPYPELQIKPQKKEGGEGEDEDQDNESDNGPVAGAGNKLKGFFNRNSQSYQLDIPLHHVIRIDSIDPTMIVIVTKDIHAIDEKNSIKDAARISFETQDDRDAASLDLKVLVEWNKNRLQGKEMEEELPGDGIRARAQKAAHFAKREIELRETKRTREQRKAKYMEGTTGGLKYTAMAMANRAG